ncbi:DUF6441 family protein [Alsobacter sp. R-9]
MTRIDVSFEGQTPREVFRDVRTTIAVAATNALRKTGDLIKVEGASEIAAAGFSPRWQRAISARVYPERGASLTAALAVRHRIPYAGVFEEGATISGKPFLWLPLPSATRFGGRFAGGKVTPRKVTQAGYQLVSINRPGKAPLLAVRSRGFGARKQFGGRQFKTGIEPLFVGVSAVTITQKFNLRRVFARGQDRLSDFFDAELR